MSTCAYRINSNSSLGDYCFFRQIGTEKFPEFSRISHFSCNLFYYNRLIIVLRPILDKDVHSVQR